MRPSDNTFGIERGGIYFQNGDERHGLRKAQRNPRGGPVWYIHKENPNWKTRGFTIGFTEDEMDGLVAWWWDYWASQGKLDELKASMKDWHRQFSQQASIEQPAATDEDDEDVRWLLKHGKKDTPTPKRIRPQDEEVAGTW
jgi:hypothetical protein